MDRPHRLLLGLLLGFLGACAAPSSSPEPLEPPLRVLLLGDSISIGYTEEVGRLLGDAALVVRPRHPKGNPENCAGTNNGVERIDAWLALEGGRWDVIHFNFGLHDLKHVDAATGKNSNREEDPPQASLERYGEQLGRIASALEASGARLVFATTTPVPDGVRPYRDPLDVQRYNAEARRVLQGRGVAVNDLYEFCLPRLPDLQKPKDVHFTSQGSRALAGEVAAAIRSAAGW